MYKNGDVIDGKYKVLGLCSDSGGMGTILHVEPICTSYPFQVVLKYCNSFDADSRARFSREARYLAGLAGNALVVQVVDMNPSADPPYFVMKYYSGGDLLSIADKIRAEPQLQESVFNKMLDCVGALHNLGLQHRDIKPQNFLREGDDVVISDLGLAKEVGAGTTMTTTHQAWGTFGYYPPEFATGGFKAATSQADVFMLGKTLYKLLTDRDPLYLTDLGIHPALYHVIERCCNLRPEARYATVAEMRQDLSLAYEVVLGRASGVGKARQMLSQIINRLNADHKYVADEVISFLDLLAKLPTPDRNALIYDIPAIFYDVLAQTPVESRLDKFLEQYEPFVKDAVGTWSYAETVADNMRTIFAKSSCARYRARALEIAVTGAIWANRFAAMNSCKGMIVSVDEEVLGHAVAAIINRNRDSFVSGIDPAACRNDAVANAVRAARNIAST